jgi:hypothetical protein
VLYVRIMLTITPSQENFILNLLDEHIVPTEDAVNSINMAEAMVKNHYFNQPFPTKDARSDMNSGKTVDFHIPAKRQKPSPELDIKAVVSGEF